MKSGCDGNEVKSKRSIELPVLANRPVEEGDARHSGTSKWRAAALVTLTLLMVVHYVQWRISGSTVSPIEPSETMYTLQNGAVNAGVIFFSLAILSTLIFGRFVCGWGCHIVALQDLCAWLLKKVGLKPRPFRSRLLVFVPLIAGLYMFVWPTALRLFAGPKNGPVIPPFTNHLVTTEFWATFPPIAVAIPFLFICGFVTVYFLGSKGFCTYACPYGGFFSLADKVAPGKIRVTDACNQCGLCTANCMANVQVHIEIKQHGMVVDPGCMKHMDCISVCPNDALYFGFGKPTVAAGKMPNAPKPIAKNYSLTWPEEALAALVFLASYLAVWDVYQLVPMLMALGTAAVTTYLFMRACKLLRSRDLAFYRYSLRVAGRFTAAGYAFLAFAFIWIGVTAHSGWIRYNESAGASAFERLQIADELALAQKNPDTWLTPADRQTIAEGRRYLGSAVHYGLFTDVDALPKLAWFEYLSGNAESSAQMLGTAAAHQQGQGRALSLYYRGAILNRLGRWDDALQSLDQALAESPDLILAAEEKGESLWQLGRRQEAVSTWSGALRGNDQLVLATYQLAGAAAAFGKNDMAVSYERRANSLTPDDAYFHWVLGLRLKGLGMNDLAERQFTQAIALDPSLRSRRTS